MSREGRVTKERQGHVLVIGMDRASEQNRLDPGLYRALATAYYELEHDDELRCGVLFGHRDDFCPGMDVVAFGPVLAQGDFEADVEGQINPYGFTDPRLSKPMVCAAHGRTQSGGHELFLACDIRIAARTTRFAHKEVQNALYPGAAATYRFSREAGWGNAMRYLLTGDEFDAEESLRMGLAQEVVEPGQQLQRAVEVAQRIAQQAPLGVRATLASAHLALQKGEAEAARHLQPEFTRLLRSQDMQERMQAAREGRAPVYRGR